MCMGYALCLRLRSLMRTATIRLRRVEYSCSVHPGRGLFRPLLRAVPVAGVLLEGDLEKVAQLLKILVKRARFKLVVLTNGKVGVARGRLKLNATYKAGQPRRRGAQSSNLGIHSTTNSSGISQIYPLCQKAWGAHRSIY